MSNIDARGAEATDSSDWNQAWSAVNHLAAARSATLRELDRDAVGATRPSLAEPASVEGAGHGSGRGDPRRAHAELASSIIGAGAAGRSAASFAPVAPDQLARDMAEIEQAAATLRRAEPRLEPQMSGPAVLAERPASCSVWVLVGVIWLVAVAVVSCAVGAAALLLS
ncbi:MAG TPA: hypothetical protein VKW08_27605 [Xanthobacteraceae bacterium]|jgi:hypothetical protein|nr:hypothetical protein [Xanthobacteraceae bacterium]